MECHEGKIIIFTQSNFFAHPQPQRGQYASCFHKCRLLHVDAGSVSVICHSLLLYPAGLNRLIPGNPDKQPEVKLLCSCGDRALIKQQQQTVGLSINAWIQCSIIQTCVDLGLRFKRSPQCGSLKQDDLRGNLQIQTFIWNGGGGIKYNLC